MSTAPATRRRISRQYHRPRPAEETFTWHEQTGGPIDFGRLRALVQTALEDGVPADAQVQVSGMDVYFTWRREVEVESNGS